MVQFSLCDISKKLDLAVVARAFQIKTRSQDTVQDISISRAAPAGEGLIGAVYRIHVKGSQHTTTFVAKGLVSDPLLRKSLTCAIYFKREILFFTQALPLLCSVQELSGAKERLQSSIPICYETVANGDDDFILMEDLSAAGFQAVSDPPTKKDIESCLKVLAHLHATSMVAKIKKPEEFHGITNGLQEIYYCKDNKSYYRNFLNNALDIDRDIIDKYENVNSVYYKKFYQLIAVDVYQQLIELCRLQGKQPVISHGDAWTSNFLSSTDRATAIDFQIFRYSSPVIDVSYLLSLCSNVCCTKEHFHEAADTYYSFLHYFLNDMGVEAEEVYSRETFWDEMLKYGRFGLLASLTSIPLIASSRCDVMESFSVKFAGYDRIPLEDLWQLQPIKDEVHMRRLINAVHVHVDVGLI